jgi:Rieske 2Fe-2S family protein
MQSFVRLRDPTMADLTDIARLFADRKPGHALPQALYTDPDVYAFDMEAIFRASWIMVGFEAELPKSGSWTSAAIGPWPILLTRDRRGDLRGFHNTCRHRGARICPPGRGNTARLVCPYHRWTYGLSGELVHAARMPADFDMSEHGLNSIHVESVGGILFVCLAETPPPIAEFKRAFEPLLAPHNLADCKLAFESVLVEKANWKLAMENARECYHCPGAHPELARFFPVGASAHFDYGEDRRQDAFAARLEAAGLPIGPVEGGWWQAMRFILNDGFTSMTMDGGFSVKRLMVEAEGGDIGSLRLAVEPNGFTHATADCVFMFSAMPTAPRETTIIAKWLVHKDAVEGVDYTIDDLSRLWTVTNLQDQALVENNQIGVESPGYRPGPYSPEAEALAIRFTDWYCRTAGAYLDHLGAPPSPSWGGTDGEAVRVGRLGSSAAPEVCHAAPPGASRLPPHEGEGG